jgi:hypothetical protein
VTVREAESALWERERGFWTGGEEHYRRYLAAERLRSTIAQRRNAGARDPPYQALVTSVYVRRDGEWLLSIHQQTP